MKISKKEALALAKVLHQHNPCALLMSAHTQHDEVLAAVAARIDRFILVDEADHDYVDEDFVYKDSPVKEQACDFFGDEDSTQVPEDEALSSFVSGENLHDLLPAKSTAGLVEFEHVTESQAPYVSLLLDGGTVIEGVTGLVRSGKSLEVTSRGGLKANFEFSRFPKDWVALLPARQAFAVEA